MKKEARVNELNHTLNNLIWGQLQVDPRSSMSADTAFKLIDWTKATDKERLAYAEWRYTYGTKVESNVDSIAVSNGIFRIVGDVIYAGRINDIDSLNIYDAGKWCKIISTPDQSKEPLFKVGDRPQWTPELIKQLPHGTELKCAYFPKDVFVYHGEEIQYDRDNDLKIKNYFDVGSSAYFTYINESKYAEILSLPDIKEASPESQQEFVKANPGMQHVEEPKAGDMVEGSNGNGWILTKFTGGKLSSGDFICEDMEYNGQRSLRNSIMFYEKIRLPQKSEVESKAKELMKVYDWTADDLAYNETLKMLIEIAKWGQANPGKI